MTSLEYLRGMDSPDKENLNPSSMRHSSKRKGGESLRRSGLRNSSHGGGLGLAARAALTSSPALAKGHCNVGSRSNCNARAGAGKKKTGGGDDALRMAMESMALRDDRLPKAMMPLHAAVQPPARSGRRVRAVGGLSERRKREPRAEREGAKRVSREGKSRRSRGLQARASKPKSSSSSSFLSSGPSMRRMR